MVRVGSGRGKGREVRNGWEIEGETRRDETRLSFFLRGEAKGFLVIPFGRNWEGRKATTRGNAGGPGRAGPGPGDAVWLAVQTSKRGRGRAFALATILTLHTNSRRIL